MSVHSNDIIHFFSVLDNINFLLMTENFHSLSQTFGESAHEMDADNKDYAFKNEISLSIGDDSVDSSTSTPSTITPPGPTPSPRQNITDDKKPLKDSKEMSKPEGIDNKAFDANEKASGKPLSSFGNGQTNGLNGDSSANGANKNGQLNEKKLAGETVSGTVEKEFLVDAGLGEDLIDRKVACRRF
jgi:hypothetical protein